MQFSSGAATPEKKYAQNGQMAGHKAEEGQRRGVESGKETEEESRDWGRESGQQAAAWGARLTAAKRCIVVSARMLHATNTQHTARGAETALGVWHVYCGCGKDELKMRCSADDDGDD